MAMQTKVDVILPSLFLPSILHSCDGPAWLCPAFSISTAPWLFKKWLLHSSSWSMALDFAPVL